MISSASGIVIHGGMFNNVQPNSRGMDLLMEWVATGAFHDSDELYDAPKCHPHTRLAVLNEIMEWVGKAEFAPEDFMLWLFGPAGAGKSAIAKRIAELASENGLLIATFFFSRTSPTRNTKNRLVATLAYQLALSIPDTRTHIEDAIERDPAIFKKNLETQMDTLLIKPFQSISSTHSPKLFIIDGLDECKDSQAQVAILDTISRSFSRHHLPIIFLIVSRPEIDIVAFFNSNEPLKAIHRRLPLDDTYKPDEDIRLFFSDKFEHVKRTHPMRSTIPISWPTPQSLETLVRRSSGQFVYAATVVRFVESNRHQPTARLNIILGISPPGPMNPFAELDALYNHVLSSVDDIQLTLRVLSLYIVEPRFVETVISINSMLPEPFLSLEQGDIYRALIPLSSIVLYRESDGSVEVLHASFVDFLFDKRRSTTFYIDSASTCTDYARRVLQYVKGPDGIRGIPVTLITLSFVDATCNSAGDFDLFWGVIDSGLHNRWIITSQLRSDVLNFDLDAFITAVIARYNRPVPTTVHQLIPIFDGWLTILARVDLKDRDDKDALDRCHESLKSRLQVYQSHWQLKLLLTLAVAFNLPHHTHSPLFGPTREREIMYSCRRAEILLQMDDPNLRLIDQVTLDLRHSWRWLPDEAMDMMSRYVDGDKYALAALHCIHFLSNPPIYSKNRETGLMNVEWKEACATALDILCKVFQRANTLARLVQFVSDNDVHPVVREEFPDNYAWIEIYILAFLSRASVCVNWRIISVIRRRAT